MAEGEVLSRSLDMARALAPKQRATFGAIKQGLFESALVTLRAPLPEWLAGS